MTSANSSNTAVNDVLSTCEMSGTYTYTNGDIDDNLSSHERAGYINEHSSDLAIYIKRTNDSFMFSKKTGSFVLRRSLVAENEGCKRRQRRYMIWNSICFLILGILLFVFAYNRAKKLEDIDISCNTPSEQIYRIFSIIPTKSLSTYYLFYGSFGLFVSIFYVAIFHIALVICCNRFNMALYVLFFSNIIAATVIFYCYIRVRQFMTNFCGSGDLPHKVSLFISIMSIYDIIWTFLPFIAFILEHCFKSLCSFRYCSYKCRPFRIKNFLCKWIAIISIAAFLLSIGMTAWYLVENEKQMIWTIIGVSLLIIKLFDIWMLLCLQNQCDIRAVIGLLGINTRKPTDFQSFKLSYTPTYT